MAALRARKHREDKPFALMVADLATARLLGEVGDAEARALTSPRRPIVLLRRLAGDAVAPSAAPGNRFLGVMLPYSPLHHLIARELTVPFVLTSGNVSDEPIAYQDDEALDRLSGIADAFLTHDRPIHMRTDDSVIRVSGGRETPLRRSRGFVPQPVTVAHPFRRPVLGCGAELKSTFCLAKGRWAFVSHHIGDLENYETLRSYLEGIEHFMRLFEVRPELVAHDLHPEYLSTKHALELDGVERVAVQHHHAHVAACLADNGEVGPVIGVAFDGLGFGTDGSMWGGEILVADLTSFRRAGHLAPVRMPGGAMAIKEPWRMAAAHLDAAFGGDVPAGLAVMRDHAERWEHRGRDGAGGDLQPDHHQRGPPLRRRRGDPRCPGSDQLRGPGGGGARAARRPGGDLGVSRRHRGRGALPARHRRAGAGGGRGPPRRGGASAGGGPLPQRPGRRRGRRLPAGPRRDRASASSPSPVASSRTSCSPSGSSPGSAAGGFRVLTHSRVPPNDGGISLGQAVVAGARDSAELIVGAGQGSAG